MTQSTNNTMNEFIEELNKPKPMLLKYVKDFDTFVIDFCKMKDIKKLEKAIEKLKMQQNSKSAKKFLARLITYLVREYDTEPDYDNEEDVFIRPSTDDGQTSFDIRIRKYMHIFYCITWDDNDCLKEIISECIKAKNYQMITNLFICGHPSLMKQMFYVFKTNPEFFIVSQQIPIHDDFE